MDADLSRWCTDCMTYHAPGDLEACPKQQRVDALEDLFTEIADQEANERLNDRIAFAVRHEEAQQAGRRQGDQG